MTREEYLAQLAVRSPSLANIVQAGEQYAHALDLSTPEMFKILAELASTVMARILLEDPGHVQTATRVAALQSRIDELFAEDKLLTKDMIIVMCERLMVMGADIGDRHLLSASDKTQGG
jgi:hypothetical protein